GPETRKRVGGEVKTRDAHIPSSIRRVYYPTHTFYLPYDECTITLEDVHFQLGLSVDRLVVTGSVSFADWGVVCGELLGLAPETIYRGWIEMAWIRKNSARLDEDSTKVEREQHARAYILQIFWGILLPNKLRNLVHLRWLLKLVNFRGANELSWRSAVLATFHMGLSTELQDIRLLLNQRLKANTPYEDLAIREVIPKEFFMNPNAWHMKVPLVVYATVEMHKTDRMRIGWYTTLNISTCGIDMLMRVSKPNFRPMDAMDSHHLKAQQQCQ
ncbi:hypothetical protein Gohar_018597, partial [Gossypium harknessii]|nr:hypothetical protein [Gossypium harknessii]